VLHEEFGISWGLDVDLWNGAHCYLGKGRGVGVVLGICVGLKGNGTAGVGGGLGQGGIVGLVVIVGHLVTVTVGLVIGKVNLGNKLAETELGPINSDADNKRNIDTISKLKIT
jgi:hypothetical protein